MYEINPETNLAFFLMRITFLREKYGNNLLLTILNKIVCGRINIKKKRKDSSNNY